MLLYDSSPHESPEDLELGIMQSIMVQSREEIVNLGLKRLFMYEEHRGKGHKP